MPSTKLPNHPPIKVSEADLEKYGTDLLVLDGWRAFKTDPVSRREWGKGFGDALGFSMLCTGALYRRVYRGDKAL